MPRLDDKVAIVTGAGQGVGRGITLALAAEGASVVVAGRTLEKVERVAKEIADRGGSALPVRCDVTLRAEVDTLVTSAVDAYGTVDTRQQRGVIEPGTPGEHHGRGDRAKLRQRTDRRAVVHAGLPATPEGPWRTSSTSARPRECRGTPASAPTRWPRRRSAASARWRQEWGRHRITVNVICPAAESPASEAFFEAHPEHLTRIERETPLGRFGERGRHRTGLRHARQRGSRLPHGRHADARRRPVHPPMMDQGARGPIVLPSLVLCERTGGPRFPSHSRPSDDHRQAARGQGGAGDRRRTGPRPRPRAGARRAGRRWW